jgi:tripartite-type tricarboxylate transporter receptor subunit TctC
MFPGPDALSATRCGWNEKLHRGALNACDALMRDQAVSRAAFAPATNYHPPLEPHQDIRMNRGTAMLRLRKLMVAVALLSVVPALIVRAGAQPADYPSRPIKIIVCLPAGGGVDTVTRIISEKLQRRLGQPIVIENKGGQSGNIGAEAVWNADPDGYTLLASQPAPITTNPLLYRNMSFDPAGFTPVAVMTRIPNTLTVRSDFPAKTAREFIAYAKNNPGKISYASQGNGTTSHLTGVMFEQATGTKLLHVPYRGTAPAINDLMGGHVDVLFNEVATSMEMNKSGRARILAVTTPQRVPDLPDIPTMQEAGLAGFESDTWNAISAPPKTPLPIVAKLNTAINEVLGTPEMQATLKALHLRPAGGTPAQMSEIVKSDTKRWGDLIRAANVTIE